MNDSAHMLLGFLLMTMSSPALADDTCPPGVYGPSADRFAAVARIDGRLRYTLIDGRRGWFDDPQALVRCQQGALVHSGEAEQLQIWQQRRVRETAVPFESHGTALSGMLIEPDDGAAHPLVVLVHGSEKSAAIGGSQPYLFAGQGLAVLVYNKRGTGDSEGDYTQNFELLADDAAAAMRKAVEVAGSRIARRGFYGGSQGGWIAPLAATRAKVDFVAVGFGLTVSPIDEDREQLLQELAESQASPSDLADARALSDATAAIIRSGFTTGFDRLADLRRRLAGRPWFATIKGEYSGDMLRMTDADLRRIGRARFDNLELIWDYDAEATLRRLSTPLLWVLAANDREAPIATTSARLDRLRRAGKPIDVYVFPNTDHGMVEYVEAPDGSRRVTRYTDGYFRLLGDWMKGKLSPPYGKGTPTR